MAFKKFDAREKRARAYAKEPQITIGKGKIFLNAAAVKTIGRETEKVDILIDESNMKLAIKQAKIDDPSAFPLVKPKNYLSGSINSKNLVREIRGVDKYNQTQRYRAEWDEDNRMLIIDLNHSK